MADLAKPSLEEAISELVGRYGDAATKQAVTDMIAQIKDETISTLGVTVLNKIGLDKFDKILEPWEKLGFSGYIVSRDDVGAPKIYPYNKGKVSSTSTGNKGSSNLKDIFEIYATDAEKKAHDDLPKEKNTDKWNIKKVVVERAGYSQPYKNDKVPNYVWVK